MPTYDYACTDCGGFDAFRSLAQRNDPAVCPDCGGESPRVFVSAPRLAFLNSNTRNAMDRNEKASHEPMMSKDVGSYGRMKHPSGCGCCSTGKKGATVTAPNGAKAFPSKRPWMISH
ncbi:zinc ribbon domain-containing protein [Aquabacterium soli]|uniref:Zinc ribbon domain-containing protein n=1 Tax=Aquabacterium soli TaxID=2493092 RepID=A0A3R8TAS8_9BURK|nr:zinc ribbon domain-containing protein [Aquabacterium soli]RRS03451.1 zinc ribbon domain-containing protein [Aquabacterium soli]